MKLLCLGRDWPSAAPGRLDLLVLSEDAMLCLQEHEGAREMQRLLTLGEGTAGGWSLPYREDPCQNYLEMCGTGDPKHVSKLCLTTFTLIRSYA